MPNTLLLCLFRLFIFHSRISSPIMLKLISVLPSLIVMDLSRFGDSEHSDFFEGLLNPPMSESYAFILSGAASESSVHK